MTSPSGEPLTDVVDAEQTGASHDDVPPLSAAARATNQLTLLLIAGASLLVVGGLIVGLGYPHTTVYADGGYVRHGSGAIVVVGALLLGASQCFLVVALLGFGIKLGITATRSVEPTSREAASGRLDDAPPDVG